MTKRVFIDAKIGNIEIQNKTLFFGQSRLPLSLIDTLIIAGGVEMSANLPIELSKARICTIFVSKNNRDFALLAPHFPKNADLKISQYEATNRRLDIAKMFLREKFISHKASLEAYERFCDRGVAR